MAEIIKRIAHIEDNPADHLLLKKILKNRHKIDHFASLTAFLSSHEPYDLVIVDLGLPETFGYETIDEVKKHSPITPLLTLTGLAGPYMTGDIIQTLIRKGANNVISKEIMCDTHFISLINEILDL